MDQAQLAQTLTDLTGSLSPEPGSSDSDLQRARRLLADAIAAGQPVASIVAATGATAFQPSAGQAPAGAGQIVAAIARASLRRGSARPRPRAPAALVHMRTVPVRSSLDASLPDWARGRAPSLTLGPFGGSDGLGVWIDAFTPLTQVSVVRGPGNDVVAVLPIRAGPPPSRPATSFRLGQGTVWLAAPKLAAASPAGSYAGFQVKGGSLDLDAPARIQGGILRIAATATASVSADLAPPPQPGPTTGPGVDACQAVVTLPSAVTARFGPNAAAVTNLSDFGATIYGTAVACTHAATPVTFDPQTSELLVPATPAPAAFTVTQADSTLFTPTGTAAIRSAAWALPVTVSPAAQLGAADGAGAVRLDLWAGLRAARRGSGTPLALAGAVVEAAPGKLVILALAAASLTQELLLWQEAAPAGPLLRRSSIQFRSAKNTPVLYVSQPGLEAVLASGVARAHLDRPLRADGTRFAVQMDSAILIELQDPAGYRALVLGAAAQEKTPNPTALALKNALFKVLKPERLTMAGSLDADGVVSGTLNLRFPVLGLLPTLPDPYAANFPTPATAEDLNLGLLTTRVTWPDPARPALSFELAMTQGLQAAGSLAMTMARRQQQLGLALLDVSGNADQLGVATTGKGFGATISESELALPGAELAVFMLPSMSWEPMYTDHPEPPSPPQPPPNRMAPNMDSDGVPTLLAMPTVTLAPMDPTPLLASYVRSRNQDGQPYQALFNLPFGLVAGLEVPARRRRGGPPILLESPGVMALNRPQFPNGLRGGLQLTLTPPHSMLFRPGAADPVFGGFTHLSPYAAQVLGGSVSTIFGGEFTTSVPLLRVDLSGYGASTFSEWTHAQATPPATVKAQFETLVGRTRYEVIQVVALIHPFHVRAVRTITVERQAAAWVHRSDSGWQPVGPGDMRLPRVQLQAGGVEGVFNVRNIAELGPEIPEPGGFIYKRVTFDADFKISPELVVRNGGFTDSSGTFIPSRGITGYLQLAPIGTLPKAARLSDILKTDPNGGPVAATIQIGATGPLFRVSRIDVTLNPDRILVAALGGTPALPATGSWSVARQAAGQAPIALERNTAIPLVRSRTVDPQHWHLADPSEIGRLDNQQDSYGLLQATGTQRSFFAAPRVNAAAPVEFEIQKQPHLADVGALLNSTGAFADIASTLGFKPGPNLKLDGDGLAVHREVDFGGVPAKPLIDFGAVKILLAYDARPFDPTATAPRASLDISRTGWSVDIKNIALVLITPFGDEKAPILWLVGDMHADQSSAPSFSNLNVRYGGKLDPVQNVFSKLSELAKSLPGGAAAGLDVHFSAGQLTVREVFALPKLPLGLGQVTDVALDLGMTLALAPKSLEFTAGIGSQEKPFHWLVSPLSGTGAVEVGVRNGDPTIMIEGGLGVGLSIDVGIAAGAASVVIALQVDNKTGDFIVRAILTANAFVDVLGGLASASITLSAALGLVPNFDFRLLPPPPRIPTQITLLAAVGVSIHLSVCWLVHVDFDGYWQFKQTLKSPITL